MNKSSSFVFAVLGLIGVGNFVFAKWATAISPLQMVILGVLCGFLLTLAFALYRRVLHSNAIESPIKRIAEREVEALVDAELMHIEEQWGGHCYASTRERSAARMLAQESSLTPSGTFGLLFGNTRSQ